MSTSPTANKSTGRKLNFDPTNVKEFSMRLAPPATGVEKIGTSRFKVTAGSSPTNTGGNSPTNRTPGTATKRFTGPGLSPSTVGGSPVTYAPPHSGNSPTGKFPSSRNISSFNPSTPAGTDRRTQSSGQSPTESGPQSRTTSPVMPAPPNPNATSLWGMWEWWCDFPQRAPRGLSKAQQAHFYAQQQNATWLDSIKSLGLFDSVEGFWGIHDCVVGPSGLPNGGNYYCFRHHIAPMWEHEANRRGGKWMVAFTPDQGAEVDKCWSALLMAVIGEQIPGDEEEVCGVAVSKRKSGFKLALWTRNAKDASTQKGIGFYMKVLLGLGKPDTPFANMSVSYLEHNVVLEQKTGASAPSPSSTPQHQVMPSGGDEQAPSPGAAASPGGNFALYTI